MPDFDLFIDTAAVAGGAAPLADLATELTALPGQLRAACEGAAGACGHGALAGAAAAFGDRFGNGFDAKAAVASSMATGLSATASAYEGLDQAFAQAQQAISDAIPDLW